jgi:hypothetical protein
MKQRNLMPLQRFYSSTCLVSMVSYPAAAVSLTGDLSEDACSVAINIKWLDKAEM